MRWGPRVIMIRSACGRGRQLSTKIPEWRSRKDHLAELKSNKMFDIVVIGKRC